jgi:hypothetical protein
MHCFLFSFTFVLNSVLLFWKLFVFEFLLGTSETLLCLVSAPQADIVPLLYAHRLLILFAGTLTYLEPKLFSSIIFYNGHCIILKLIIRNKYECMYIILSRRIMA